MEALAGRKFADACAKHAKRSNESVVMRKSGNTEESGQLQRIIDQSATRGCVQSYHLLRVGEEQEGGIPEG